MKHNIFFMMLLLACFSCEKNSVKDEALELYKESMKIHDDIMPRMDELFTLRKQLNNRIDSLKADSIANAATIKETLHAIDRLKAADEAMMDWMHNIIDVPGSAESHDHHGDHENGSLVDDDKQIEIQKMQKIAIENVRKDMLESIGAAKSVLEN